MQKNTHAASGHELPPSLLATSPRGAPSDRDEAEAPQGILDVIGQGHRPRMTARPRGRWMAFASIAWLCLLGGGWWAAMPSTPDRAGKGGAAMSAPAMPSAPADRPAHVADVAEAAAPVPAPAAARIEHMEPQVQAQALTREAPAQAQSPDAKLLPPSPARTAGSGNRSAATLTPTPAPTRPRAVAARTPDPDVEVIEVLLSRTTAAPASNTPARARQP